MSNLPHIQIHRVKRIGFLAVILRILTKRQK